MAQRITTKEPRLRFDGAIILLHWLTVLLVAALLVTGFATQHADDTATLDTLLAVHRSLGVSVFVLTALRLIWRLGFAALPPFPEHMLRIQQWAAKANEYGLYALLFLQPISGFGDTLFRGKPFELFGQTVPALLPRIPSLFKPLHLAHEYGAKALLALIGLHAAAALFHQYVLRDKVLKRMWPGNV